MNYALLAAQLVRHLRGTRSQMAVSRRLGHRSNVVYPWEAGLRAPSASDFLLLAARSRIDVNAGLTRFYGQARDWLPTRDAEPGACIAPLLRDLRGQRTVSELARAVGATRLTIMRWLGGETAPRLPELLRFVDATTQRLLDFVAVFADPAELPETRAAWADLQAQLRVAYELPWSHAVLRALELTAYARLPRHEPGFLAARLGISVTEENECLAALERAGQIQQERGCWTLRRVIAVDTRRDPVRDRALKRHWAQLGLERIDHTVSADPLFSFNLFAVSNADYERIREMHLAYYAQLRAVVSESKHPERVVLTNLQLFPLDAGLQTHGDDDALSHVRLAPTARADLR